MPRFVILEHHYLGVHWDFMLEAQGVLNTWRLELPPMAGQTSRAERLADHRRVYLSYEGEISGGRGHVIRWDEGEFEWLVDEPSLVEARLSGSRTAGLVQLRCGESGVWTFKLTSADSVSRPPEATV